MGRTSVKLLDRVTTFFIQLKLVHVSLQKVMTFLYQQKYTAFLSYLPHYAWFHVNNIRHIRNKETKIKRSYPKPVISANNSESKDVLLIIKKFQPFSAGCGWEPRLHIYFSDTPDLKVTLHYTPANKGLVLLRLIKSPYQRPYLMFKKIQKITTKKSGEQFKELKTI